MHLPFDKITILKESEILNLYNQLSLVKYIVSDLALIFDGINSELTLNIFKEIIKNRETENLIQSINGHVIHSAITKEIPF